jgi:hypothetical protein
VRVGHSTPSPGKQKLEPRSDFTRQTATTSLAGGAIDFDAHNGEHEQARRRALEAFSILLQQPQFHLILCASGNGYHLFIYARDFFPVGQWIVLLKQVCEWVGAPNSSGVCEIFPNERAESQATGKGIRAPGTLNPKTNTLSLVEAQTVAGLLETLPRTWTSGIRKARRALPLKDASLSQHRSTNNYFLTTYSGSTEAIVEACFARHAVKAEGTRNEVLMALIGELAHKFGREAAERIMKEHYRRNQGNICTALEAHRHDFGNAWEGMREKILGSFSPAETEVFNQLSSEHQREGFVIVRAFAGAAEYNKEPDFQVSRASLADRLSVTEAGAGCVIEKLTDVNAIHPTLPCVRGKSAARFRWMLNSCTHRRSRRAISGT